MEIWGKIENESKYFVLSAENSFSSFRFSFADAAGTVGGIAAHS